VLGLQLLQLVEVADDRLVVDVADAVHADVRAERLLVVGEGVARAVTGVGVGLVGGVRCLGGLETGEVGRVDVLERVVEDVELARHPRSLQILRVVGVAVHAPLVVVGDLDAAAARGGGRRGGRLGGGALRGVRLGGAQAADERGGRAEGECGARGGGHERSLPGLA
jgi:hypothetical protein